MRCSCPEAEPDGRRGDPARRRVRQGEPLRLRARSAASTAWRRWPTTRAATGARRASWGADARSATRWPCATCWREHAPRWRCAARAWAASGHPRRGRGARRSPPWWPSARRPAELLLRGLRVGRLTDFAVDATALERVARRRSTLFAAVASLGAATALLLLHARGDEQVPYTVSEELHEAAHEPKRLLVFPGGHHRSLQHDLEVQNLSAASSSRRWAPATPENQSHLASCGMDLLGALPSPADLLELRSTRRALLELALLAVAGGVAGAFVVLRRLAFFSHAVGTRHLPRAGAGRGRVGQPAAGRARRGRSATPAAPSAPGARGRDAGDAATGAPARGRAGRRGSSWPATCSSPARRVDRLLFGTAIAPGGRRPGLRGAGGRAGAGCGARCWAARGPRRRSTPRARPRSGLPLARADLALLGAGRARGGRRAPGRGRPAGHLDLRRARRHRAAVRPARGRRWSERRWPWRRAQGVARAVPRRSGSTCRPARRSRCWAPPPTARARGRRWRRRAPRRSRHERGRRGLPRAGPGLRRRAGADRGRVRRRARAPRSACSAPTAAARRRCSARSPASSPRSSGAVEVAGRPALRGADRAHAARLPGQRARRGADGHAGRRALVAARARRASATAARAALERVGLDGRRPTRASASCRAASASGC